MKEKYRAKRICQFSAHCSYKVSPDQLCPTETGEVLEMDSEGKDEYRLYVDKWFDPGLIFAAVGARLGCLSHKCVIKVEEE